MLEIIKRWVTPGIVTHAHKFQVAVILAIGILTVYIIVDSIKSIKSNMDEGV